MRACASPHCDYSPMGSPDPASAQLSARCMCDAHSATTHRYLCCFAAPCRLQTIVWAYGDKFEYHGPRRGSATLRLNPANYNTTVRVW